MNVNCFGNSDRVPSIATIAPSISSAKLIASCPSMSRRYSFTMSRGWSWSAPFVNSKSARWRSSCFATNSSKVETPTIRWTSRQSVRWKLRPSNAYRSKPTEMRASHQLERFSRNAYDPSTAIMSRASSAGRNT